MIRVATYGELARFITEQNLIAKNQGIAEFALPPKVMYANAVAYFNNQVIDPDLVELCREREITIIPLSSEITDLYKDQETNISGQAIAGVIKSSIGYVLAICLEKLMALDAINRKAVYVHELTHYDQMVAGRLVFNFDLGLIYWLGEPYISFAEIPKATIEEYLQWPWEIEAYEAQGRVL